MKRRWQIAITAALGLVLAAVTAVPISLASRVDPQNTRYRYFQDLSVTGQFPGRIVFGLLYRENRHGEFTPREAVAYSLDVGVSCNPGGAAEFGFGGSATSKYAYFRQVLQDGRFSHRFENQFENPQLAPWKGSLNGRVLKRLKRSGRVTRTARIDGTFNVEDWDPYGMAGIRENCTTSASYSATPCKVRMSPRSPHYDRWKRWKVPVCYQSPW
jgi:hypothetical protein